jgi:AraC-like DNA-binding protein
LAKIAVAVEHALSRRREHGTPGCTTPRIIARGDGWTAADVVCTSGPGDRAYEEQHTRYLIAVVLAGSFQYRSELGDGLMTPGSLMLGNQGQCFECGHEHGEGDRCVSFWYERDYFERLAADAGARGRILRFPVSRLPPLRSLSPLVARAELGATGSPTVCWEELAMRLAASAVRLANGVSADSTKPGPNAEARVTRTVRTIDTDPHEQLTLRALAREADLSPYHFLRTFERLIGVTPHQYLMRARLRKAAMRLVSGSEPVIDAALASGFGDISNFNRAFRAEFGVSPRIFRRAGQ